MFFDNDAPTSHSWIRLICYAFGTCLVDNKSVQFWCQIFQKEVWWIAQKAAVKEKAKDKWKKSARSQKNNYGFD